MPAVEASKRIVLKNILFATDFSDYSNAALPYALSVARRYGATLHAAHVMPTMAQMVLFSPECWPAMAEEADEERVKECVEELEKQFKELPHDVLTPRGKVAEAIAGIIKKQKIDVLVLGTHGRTGLGKLFAGSVAEEIFRQAPCPVLSIGPHVATKRDSQIRFQHVLFATDFSPGSLAALPYAIYVAEEDRAELDLLHVVEQPAAGIVDIEAVNASLMHRLKALVADEPEPSCHAGCLIEFGRQFALPSERILDVAEDRSADLIVLGARSAQGKLGLVTHLASTAAQILTHAACPVLTVRAEFAQRTERVL
ncbi:MAG: universal stress protein [Terriglobales bacterium]